MSISPVGEAISQHLAECPRCERIVQSLKRNGPGALEGLHAADTDASLFETRLAQEGTFVTDFPTDPIHVPAAKPRGQQPLKREFLPGTRITDRYRIVSLLGRGGMGEVYHADDLRLGQPVALKFISTHSAASKTTQQYFLEEVRLSQRLSHPHICRVHDLVEVDSLLFLSMQYIEGEDLQTLLARMGPLPESKVVEFSRQLCQGLAAAHEAGVLHRDLKPANIMVDRRGRALITDFGLAREHEHVNPAEGIVGTPLYMAPEQLSRNRTSVQSDLYSLALIIYEMYTGRPAHRAKAVDEIRELHDSNSAGAAALGAVEIAPEIGGPIATCLTKNPAHRPESVAAFAASLPGQSAMEVAVATGKTLSPELLAIAGPKGALSYRSISLFAILIMAALSIACWLSSITMRALGDLKPPEVLVDRAEQILEVAKSSPGVSTARGFAIQSDAMDWVKANGVELKSEDARFFDSMIFWYRASDQDLAPLVPDWSGDQFLRVDQSRPRVGPGQRSLRLNPDGELRFFENYLNEPTGDSGSNDSSIDWSAFFELAGLSEEQIEQLVETEPHHVTRGSSNVHRSWTLSESGSGSKRTGAIRFEAASLGSQPTYFHVVGPWTPTRRDAWSGALRLHPVVNAIALIWIPIMLIGTAYLARKNLYAKRADLDGANRVACFAGITPLLIWFVGGAHVRSSLEMDLLLTALAGSCTAGIVVWANYLAFEPVVRREYPGTLVSWKRLLEGHFRDKLIGRHLLIGVAAGVSVACAKLAMLSFPMLFGQPPADAANAINLIPIVGGRVLVGEILAAIGQAVLFSIFYQLLLLVLLRLALRKMSLAAIVFVLFMAVRVAVQYDPFWFSMTISTLEFGLTAYLFLRAGLLSVIAMHFVRLVLKWPLVMDSSSWISTTTWWALSIVILSAVAGVLICRPSEQPNRPTKTNHKPST